MFSILPLSWQSHKFLSIVLAILFLVWLNLRGVKESIQALTPIFMAFLLTHVPLLLYAVTRHFSDMPLLANRVSTDLSSAVTEVGWFGVAVLLMRAYSMRNNFV